MDDALARGTARSQCATEPCAALHARLRRPLQRFFATYRLNAEDVDDFTQEVFLRLLGVSRSHQLRSPDAFVFTMARNLVRDRARRLQTRATSAAMSLEDADLACGRPTPEQALEQQDRLHQAIYALEGLKSETRRAFYLNRVDGHSYAQTALEMGVSVSMVEKHLMAAIAALRQHGAQ